MEQRKILIRFAPEESRDLRAPVVCSALPQHSPSLLTPKPLLPASSPQGITGVLYLCPIVQKNSSAGHWPPRHRNASLDFLGRISPRPTLSLEAKLSLDVCNPDLLLQKLGTGSHLFPMGYQNRSCNTMGMLPPAQTKSPASVKTVRAPPLCPSLSSVNFRPVKRK